MQIEQLPITALRPAPYNPRVTLQPGDPRWDRLQRSIREFDLVQPVVWNRRTGHVVGGHQRLAVLRTDGHERVDCVVVDLPLEREQALNVALNNPEVGGEWDPDLLSGLLEELADLPEFDATLTGFDKQRLRDLMFVPAEEPPQPLEDDPEPEAVVAMLEVPLEEWDAVEPRLNELLAAHKGVRLHVKPPRR
jgi:ParB-like chromosome segregation protein Spo0J